MVSDKMAHSDLPRPDGLGTSVAVIIPTKNRPLLLEEAISSACEQTYTPQEIIVVDDASASPVDETTLRDRYGPSIRVLRNASTRGLAFSRNRGVEECSTDYFIHLDDDDLLAKDAIERCVEAAYRNPDVQVWCFGARGFGERSEYFNKVQSEGVRAVKGEAAGIERYPGILVFDRQLLLVLLRRVPSAFQRVFTSPATWRNVSRLRWRVYMLDSGVIDETTAKFAITGYLRDSEWVRYAAVVCDHVGLIDMPLYLARCEGQGYSSQPRNRQLHADQAMLILRHMKRGTEALPELAPWKKEVANALSRTSLSAAYHWQQAGDRRQALQHLKKSMAYGLRIKHFRLALRLLLPFRKT